MLADLFPKMIADQINPKNETQSNIAYAAKLYGINQITDEIFKVAFKSSAQKVQERLAELELRRRALEAGLTPKQVMNGEALREKSSSLPSLATIVAASHGAPKAVAAADGFLKSIYAPKAVAEAAKYTKTFTFAKNPVKLGFLTALKVR